MSEFENSLSVIEQYFPDLTAIQKKLFTQLPALYAEWNEKVNVISRKDIDRLMSRHVLHSLAIAKAIRFDAGAKVMDIGTGGGFPGVPLAILYPEVEFTLVDSIEKKIKVLSAIVEQLELKNVTVLRSRAEELKLKVDYVVSRATAPMTDLINWSRTQCTSGQKGSLPNGWVVLKGGDLDEELHDYRKIVMKFPVSDFFRDPFYDQKLVIYIPRQVL
jgi:16S rRNA (guanine527-N7)-methyltransferase